MSPSTANVSVPPLAAAGDAPLEVTGEATLDAPAGPVPGVAPPPWAPTEPRTAARTGRGSVAYQEMWSAIIVPHVAVGPGTPAPRYDSVVSNRTVAAIPSAA